MAVKNSDVSLVFNGLKLLITLRYYKHFELNISISKNTNAIASTQVPQSIK